MAGLVTILGNPKRKKRRKMSALQMKYFGKRRKRKARASTSTKRRKRKGEVVIVATSNPRRKSVARKRRRKSATSRRRVRRIRARQNPRPVRRRRSRSRRYIRARRNPRILAGGPMGFLTNSLVPAAVGAAGAIAVDMAVAKLTMIPQTWKTGNMLPITKIGLSIGLGAVGSAVLGNEYGEQLAAGGIVVSLYQLARNYVNQNFPSLQMARYVPMRGMGAMRRGRRMGFIMRRRRLGNLPPNFKMRTIMRGAAIPGVNAGGGNGGMGYIGPARTMGRYLNK